MSQLLTNNFELPPDNWYHISSLGEFKHNPTGLIQIIDEDSCRSMVEGFNQESATPNFPGILIDFDHFSLDHDKPSEAAGWIVKLEHRPTGLWAQIRWTDKGEEAVRGGRYRFISPVFRQDECLDLGNNRVKPKHLINAAVTNDPNISGMVPLSNKKADQPAIVPMLVSLGSRDHALLNRAVFIANGGTPVGDMTDEQRKAMFAHMHGGGGGGGGGGGWGGGGGGRGGGGGNGGGSGGSGSSPQQPYDYSSSRDFDARIGQMEQYRDQVAAQAPTPPELKSFETVDVRQLRMDLLRQGMSFADIDKQASAAEERNRAIQKELKKVKDEIKAKYKDPKKQKAALQAYFDKVNEQNSRALSDYEQRKSQHQSVLDEIDRDIAVERIRQEEAETEEARRLYNDQTRQLNRQEQQVIREQIEADKAELKAQAEAERLASPEYQMKQEQQQVSQLKSLWRNAANGDEQGMMRDLKKLGVDPATVDMEAFIKEASSIGVVGRDASWSRRQQARQDKANAYNRPIPGVDEEPIQVVPRNTLYLKKDRTDTVTERTEKHAAPQGQVESFRRYQKEYDEIDARNKRGAMPDWMAKQEKQAAWQRHLKRTKEEEEQEQ